ncbi:MAG: hypothetical protein IPG93_12100 [Burkholderiales bacterium]|nr:hypothetical protein [Burkholderiales bacterium]
MQQQVQFCKLIQRTTREVQVRQEHCVPETRPVLLTRNVISGVSLRQITLKASQMRSIALSLLMLASSQANADAFYKLVGFKCETNVNKLVLTYDAAANSEGEAMMRTQTVSQWDPWSLVRMKDDENVESLQTIERHCKLNDGIYTVRLGPVPGNWNIQRRCGTWISAWAEVRKGEQIVYRLANFEQGVGCFYADGEITTRVEIRPKQRAPKLTITPAIKLLSGT